MTFYFLNFITTYLPVLLENNDIPTSSIEDQLEQLHLIPSGLPSDSYSPEDHGYDDGENSEEEYHNYGYDPLGR